MMVKTPVILSEVEKKERIMSSPVKAVKIKIPKKIVKDRIKGFLKLGRFFSEIKRINQRKKMISTIT
jgi:hypothetical protein